MKVTFTYINILGGTATTALVLGEGQKLSPLSPVAFGGQGKAQVEQYLRAATAKIIPRGGAEVTESLVCQREHANYAAAVAWSRVEIRKALGMKGTLRYEFDGGAGAIRLNEAVLTGYKNAPGVVGLLTLIEFSFLGASWANG